MKRRGEGRGAAIQVDQIDGTTSHVRPVTITSA
jgi:hypothetical protein